MKLQELLFKHYKEYTNSTRDSLLEVQVNGEGLDDERIIYKLYGDKLLEHYYFTSLSYILFSTPFLNLLEWEKADSDFVTYDYDVYGILSPNTRRLSTHEHHKINLVLLNTDEERIKYIEAFTI